MEQTVSLQQKKKTEKSVMVLIWIVLKLSLLSLRKDHGFLKKKKTLESATKPLRNTQALKMFFF